MNTWGVTLEQVTTHWGIGGAAILEKIDLTIKISSQANLFPLMGPSGQGKSTLLYLLATLKWPQAGQIRWTFPNGHCFAWGAAGQPSAPEQANDLVKLRRQYFGFAFQNSTLSPYLTVLENIAYPLLLQGLAWQQASEQAQTTLQAVLLSHEPPANLAQRFPNQLSGGQRQRVALAQALVHNPYVLFADEPTGQLDLPSRQQVMNVLKRWVANQPDQRALIWVTHHHLDDLDLMNLNHLIFIENKTCQFQTRTALTHWITQYQTA